MFSAPTQWQYSCYVFSVTRTTLALIAIAACIALASSATPRAITAPRASADAMPLPKIMLWAWERPDDLRALSPSEAGVAYLAGTIYAQENSRHHKL